AVTPEGFGFDPQRGELWFAGDTAEAVLLEMQARRRELADEADELAARARTAARAAEEAAARAAEAEAAYTPVAQLRSRSLDATLIARLHSVAAGLERALATASRHAGEIEATITAEMSASAGRAAGQSGTLRRLADEENGARRVLAEATTAVRQAELALARLGAPVTDALGAAGGGRVALGAEAVDAGGAGGRAEGDVRGVG